ncbi:hypothetical protein FJY70_01800, partial [candidate division WOR-3 bacterium]|nr:hypothetical protein [candidate division WOR-3 bacterium]
MLRRPYTAAVLLLVTMLPATGVASDPTLWDATVPYHLDNDARFIPTPPTDDSMWVKIDSIRSQTSYQGIFIHGDTVYCSNQSNAVHVRSRLTGDTIYTFATRSGSAVIAICRFGDSLCISRLSSPEMCEVYTLSGTYVRQFNPSGGQQVRGLDWDGTKFWASSYLSAALTIYTMNRGGTVLKTLGRSGGNQVPISIARDITLDRMYANRLWSAPSTSTPHKVMYVGFDTTANTYTVLDTFRTGLASYMSGIEFYNDPVIGGCVYVNTFSNSGWMWRFKVHEPMGSPGDVGTLRVIGPSGNIPYGVPVIPQAKVKNYSTVAQTFPVRFNIGTVYSNTQVVRDLAAGDSATVNFASWAADVAGPHATKCSTMLHYDTLRSNDKATGNCFVPLVDAGVRAILAPTGTIPYGTPVQPQARVKNFGTAVIPSFSVKFTIGGFYRDSVTVTNLGAGESTVVNFRNWAADTAGTFTTRCTTRLAGDQIPADDTLSGSVFCQLTDAAVVCIYAPPGGGVVDSGISVAPRCTVINRGTQTATFNVDLHIGSAYSATASVNNVPPATKRVVGFATNWVPVERGWVQMRCSTKLSGDLIPSNDRKRDSVFVRVADIGAVRITSPIGAILPGPVIPSADVRNWGNSRDPCRVYFRINSTPPYYDSVVLPNGLPYADTSVRFPSWSAVGGAYTARCSTFLPGLPGDRKRSNDTCSVRFAVGTIDASVTALLAPVGSADSAVQQTPKARVKNTGTAPATGAKAVFTIDSTVGNPVYCDTLTV